MTRQANNCDQLSHRRVQYCARPSDSQLFNRDTKLIVEFESFQVTLFQSGKRIDYIRPLLTDLLSPLRCFEKKIL